MPPSSGTCPYPGLVPFDAADHENFFGRDAGDRRRARSTRVLAGAGAQRPLRVWQELAAARWDRRRAAPPRAPCARSPWPVSTRWHRSAPPGAVAGPNGVVAIDQAEELLTAEDVGSCGAELTRHVAGGGRVLLAVRADALADLAMAADLTVAVERGLYLVRPLRGAALRAAIVEPAQRAGLRLEAGLLDLVLHDVEDQPDALPLLSHALVETWQRREGATLTVAGYEDSGRTVRRGVAFGGAPVREPSRERPGAVSLADAAPGAAPGGRLDPRATRAGDGAAGRP